MFFLYGLGWSSIRRTFLDISVGAFQFFEIQSLDRASKEITEVSPLELLLGEMHLEFRH